MNSECLEVKKHRFKLKYKLSDGNILQVHHTICPSFDKVKCIRFLSAVFDTCDRFACSDQHGNIFMFDMVACEYWTLSGHEPSSVMAFTPYEKSILMLATINCPFNILFIDVVSGKLKSKLSGHKSEIKMVTFSSKHDLLLTSTGLEAIIWELTGKTLYFKLNFCVGRIIQISFQPVSDHILACFKNDTFRMWGRQTLKPANINLPTQFRKIRSFAYTANGRVLVIGTCTSLSVHHADNWQTLKCIETNKIDVHGVRQLAFLPQPLDGGCNKIIAVLSNRGVVHLLDVEKFTKICSLPTEVSSVNKIVSSGSGKYLACILKFGQINIFKSEQLLMKFDSKTICPKSSEKCQEKKRKFTFEPVAVDNEKERGDKIDEYLNKYRLGKILKLFCEYPDKNRMMIWKALLKTPNNYEAYCDLISRPVHPNCRLLDKCINIKDSIYLKHTKRVVSSLNYWCPMLTELGYLHIFVFPFVKIMHHDPLYCFEAVATILKNYCQLWFERCPLAPTNVLAIIENILEEHDKPLLNHLCAVGVTTQLYAFSLMTSVFSEVLSSAEWLKLWDHILSNEPAFILMAIVAYSIVHRKALKGYCNTKQFEDFYFTQNCTNMDYFIKKTYDLLNSTSKDVHPRQYLKSFSPLRKGLCYSQCKLRAG